MIAPRKQRKLLAPLLLTALGQVHIATVGPQHPLEDVAQRLRRQPASPILLARGIQHLITAILPEARVADTATIGMRLQKLAFRIKLLKPVQPANGGIHGRKRARLTVARKPPKLLARCQPNVLGTRRINTVHTALRHQLVRLVTIIIPNQEVSA